MSFTIIRLKYIKKAIYYLLLILLLFSDISSQSFCEYGLKIGLTIANQLYDYPNNFLIKDEKYQYRYGINFGLFVELFEFQHFSFLVDLSYNQKGMINEMLFSKLDPSSPSGYTSEKKELDNRLDYLTINSGIKTRYNLGNFSPYILTGIKYDILIGKKIDRTLDRVYEKIAAYYNIYDRYLGNIFGLTFGLGVENKNLLGLPILIEWIYNYDLTKVKINEYLKIKNLSNELKIGIKF